MLTFTEHLNVLSALGIIGLQLITVVIIVSWLHVKLRTHDELDSLAKKILSLVRKYGTHAGFLVTFSAMLLSLVYSDIIGFEPCKLCWIQRILIYPQALILGLALWKKTRDSAVYCWYLSIIGLVIATYHYYGQMFNPNALPCSADGVGSCAVRFFVEFGYITIPMMSFTVFLFMAIVTSIVHRHQKSS